MRRSGASEPRFGATAAAVRRPGAGRRTAGSLLVEALRSILLVSVSVRFVGEGWEERVPERREGPSPSLVGEFNYNCWPVDWMGKCWLLVVGGWWRWCGAGHFYAEVHRGSPLTPPGTCARPAEIGISSADYIVRLVT